MSQDLRKEHECALTALERWFQNLIMPTNQTLEAPTFYSEIALRHIVRQLGMSAYLPVRSKAFVRDAQKHTLQPWQMTEILYASSIEINALLPIIPVDDPLLLYLAHSMIERIRDMPAHKQAMYQWLGEEENKVLGDAIQRLRIGENKDTSMTDCGAAEDAKTGEDAGVEDQCQLDRGLDKGIHG